MQKRVIATILALAMAGACVAALSADPKAILSEVKGKVEIKAPGGTWTKATDGMELPVKAQISTGFDATVTVLVEKTKIFVKPLTRMAIDKLIDNNGTVTTSTFLRVGSVEANVKSAEGTRSDFKVTSPYSTASVRGTEFAYDGLNLRVNEGVVTLQMGRPQRVTQPTEGTEGGSESPDPDDYAGTPELPQSAPVFVSAGHSASIKIPFTAQVLPPSVSSGRATLDGGSAGNGTPPGAILTVLPTKGTVTVTWSLGGD